jgi:1-acyl-sn-glycerol-3-phosphate acyltransferase
LYVASVPLLLIIALILSYRFPGRLRLVRAVGLFSVYFFVEAAVMVAGFVLWVASGFGWKLKSPAFIAAHYALMRWALRMLVGAGQRLYELEITHRRPGGHGESGQDIDTPAGADLTLAGEDTQLDNPMIVMARHAGPADSVLLMNELMSGQGRRPRIVVKDLLQIDPAFDLLLNRLPNRFVPSKKTGPKPNTVALIGELAADMGPDDAFVIFPEGGNFTPGRRLRAIDRLRTAGHEEAAERAEALRNVLPPRPAGSLAALAAAPEADVVFVAHTGLDAIATPADVWFELAEGNELLAAWYRIPAAQVPTLDQDREEMLMRAWERIDVWVENNRPVPR